ncbi:MFS transporter [Vulcanisaeta thermophila]|uniref:MFS transporter n=1 Tax=Vulcanisaeta thermophila TaxID=867917 RepID=UPI000853DDA8|nr:MFS transporter [Vulcanisaeta thermophila]
MVNGASNDAKEYLKRYGVKGSPSLGLTAGTIAFFAGFAAVALFGVTVHSLAKILHLSIVEVGWLVAAPLITGALLRIPFSVLVDRYGGRPVILTQLIIALMGMAGLIVTIHYILIGAVTGTMGFILLMITGAVAGTGISTFASGITYVSYWYPQKRQGFALGAFAGIGNAAPGIFTVILPYALATLGLVGSYIAWAVFLAVMTAIFAVIGFDAYFIQLVKKGVDRQTALNVSRDLGEELFPSGSASASLSRASRIWRTWLLVIMYFISFGGFEALTEWLPTYWQNYLSVSVALAGVLTGVAFSLITALIRVPGGWLSDLFTGERVAVVSYSIMVIGSVIMMLSHSLPLSITGIIIMAVGMGIANAAVYKMVPKYVPEAVGGASGLVGGLGSAGGLLIPPTMAYFVALMGRAGYPFGFVIYLVLGLVSVVLSVILMRTSR